MHPVLALCERNAWANREVLRACAALDPHVLERECPGTFGPVARTLAHVLRGTRSGRGRAGAPTSPAIPSPIGP